MNKIYVSLIAVLLMCNIAFAQSFYNNGAVVTISSGAIFSVQDSLVNSGTLTNNGNMVIGGVWYNQGTYNPGTGEITFNSPSGAAPQIINHNNQSFSKLTIKGGGEKLILANMTIVGELILNDGIIASQNNARVLFQESAVITGGSDASHINAPVYQFGSGAKLFPVGNGTKYLPVSITGIPSVSEVGITLTEFPSSQELNTTSQLSDISDKRYWSIDVVEGSLQGAKIVLPLVGDEGLNAQDDRLVVAHAVSLTENFENLGRGTGSNSTTVESESSPSSGLVTLAVVSENQSIVVFNAISSNPDDEINNYIHIDNLVEGDVVSIYNRWGDLVFEMKNYENGDVAKRFNGQSNVGGGKDLPTGNYFYVIRRKAGKEVSGYLSLRK